MRLLAKTCRPVARLIGRPGAVAPLLAEPAPLTWIVGPAGAGKTSLALELCAASGAQVAWLRLDETDTDPASFLLYLEQAIGNGGLAPGWHAPELLREHLPALQGYLRLFIRSLGAASRKDAMPGCIVMDDAHRCQDTPFFKLLLDVLAAELPPAIRVVIVSRAAPPDACARLIANGALHALDATALAFSRAETEVLLNVLGVGHAEAVGNAVFHYTRGWPAGVALVAAWLRRWPAAVPGAQDVLSEPMVGYLAEEVFGAFGPEQQATLLAVCWLPYFNGAWSVTLSGWTEAADFLARLAAQGGLIYEYPGRQYALHPLLQGFLRKWATARLPRAERCATIAACIDLLHGSDNSEAAIELALEHGLPERAASLISAHAQAMLASARHATLAHWIDTLPEQYRDAWHYYWLGLAVFMSDTARARSALLRALPAFTALSEPRHRFLALSTIISSYFFSGAADEPLRGFLQRHVDAEADYANLPDPALQAHLTHSVWSAMFMTDPGHRDMPLWQGRALDALRGGADTTLKVRLASMLAQHFFQTGRYASLRSLHALMAALPESAAMGAYARYLSFLLRLYADVASLDMARVDATYAAACASSDDTGIRIMAPHYALIHASACMLRGDVAKAQAIVDGVAAQTPPRHYNLVGHLQLTQAWLASWRGDGRAALEHAELAQRAAHSFGSVPYEVYAAIAATLARTLFERHACTAAVTTLRGLGATCGSPLACVHADLFDAWLALTGTDGAALAPAALRRSLGSARLREAQQALAAALEAIMAEGTPYLTFATPHILTPLCAHALACGIAVDAAQALVRGYRLAPPDGAGANWPRPVQLRVFGPFDLRLDGAPLASQGKSKHRQLDMLKLVAAHAPGSVPADRAAELLWPDTDGDSARHALETTLSRLRATIGAGTVLLKQGALSLAPDLCWCDAAALDDALPVLAALTREYAGQLQAHGYHREEQAQQGGADWPGDAVPPHGGSLQRGPIPDLARAQGDEADAEALLAAAHDVMALYRGDLLAGDGAPWLLARRELWRGKVVRALGGTASALAQAGDAAAAALLLEHALEADPCNKVLSAQLIGIHLDCGQYDQGMAAYRRYQRIAQAALGTAVSADIERLAQRLLAGAAHTASGQRR